MTLNQKKNVALGVASLILFVALIDGWQYGFFTILRFTVFTTTAYVAWLAYEEGKEGWTWFLGAIAVLFNPFVSVSFDREVWMIIDFISGAVLTTSIFLLRLTK